MIRIQFENEIKKFVVPYISLSEYKEGRISMSKENNKRLVKNTGFLYARMLILMAIGFFTSRKILEALGVEDLGIYNVVGSLIIMFDFVSSGLSNATQRYLNIGLGENNIEKTRQYFSQSLVIHLAFAFIIAIIAETAGLWFVMNKLIIPPERLDAAIMILHFSVLSLVFRFIKTCYESDVIARESMSIYAYLSILEGIGKLAVCYAVIYYSSIDKLILYGFLILLINAVITLFNVIYCSIKFKETHIRYYSDKYVYKELLSFIGINSFGVISWALGKQGINVVINMFFGPAVNGSRGLASQLDGVISQFATNINVAVRPQLTKLYAQDRLNEMVELAHKSTKFIFFLAFVISIPFLFQTEEILSIWLKEVPPYTTLFVQILIFEVLGNILGTTYNSVSMSIGKIKNIQVYGRLITLSGLPISYFILNYYENPYMPTIIMMVLTFVYSVFIVWDINKQLQFGMMLYCKKVIFPIISTMTLSVGGCWCISCLLSIDNEVLSLAILSLVQCTFSSFIIYLFGIENEEREFIKQFIKNRI